MDVSLLALVLPLGISFFTFHQIGYQIDRWRGQASEHNLLDYALFVTFFPQLIAGPIVRQSEFLPQLKGLVERLGARTILIGLTIFSIGLFKKVIFADSFVLYATPVFDTAAKGGVLDGQTAWLGTLAYTFQIYFDFSGYSDMAIGLARMVGINLPINFNAPYRSTSITEFWRRWHITLGRFLRDYLYFPLGGSRVPPLRHFANLMAVMLLCGLWHGAAWTFIVWGGLHGLALSAHRLWLRLSSSETSRSLWWRSCAWVLTFAFVVVTWVFFRAKDLGVAMSMLQSMFSPSSFGTATKIEGLEQGRNYPGLGCHPPCCPVDTDRAHHAGAHAHCHALAHVQALCRTCHRAGPIPLAANSRMGDWIGNHIRRGVPRLIAGHRVHLLQLLTCAKRPNCCSSGSPRRSQWWDLSAGSISSSTRSAISARTALGITSRRSVSSNSVS